MPPEVPNGVITQYSIQLNGTDISSLSSNELMCTIEGLSPDTVYVLQVRAHNEVGAGPSSSITVVTCKFLIIYRSIHCTKLCVINVQEYINMFLVT